MQASLLSILHCSAASALSSARLFASSYEISSSSEGPAGESGRLMPALDTDAEGEGAGTSEAVVAIDTFLSGATNDSAEAATG